MVLYSVQTGNIENKLITCDWNTFNGMFIVVWFDKDTNERQKASKKRPHYTLNTSNFIAVLQWIMLSSKSLRVFRLSINKIKQKHFEPEHKRHVRQRMEKNTKDAMVWVSLWDCWRYLILKYSFSNNMYCFFHHKTKTKIYLYIYLIRLVTVGKQQKKTRF